MIMGRMADGENEGMADRDAVRNAVEGPAGPVVQAGAIGGDVVIGAEPGRDAAARGSRPDLDEWAEGLARAVRAFWHGEEAQRQIHDPVPLPVRWHADGSGLADHWANIRRLPAGAEAEPLSLSGRLEQAAEVYERVPSRRLVVLGPTGAGKTVLAGRLALQLLTARRTGEPVPVIVSIGAWNPATTSLHTWLAEQIARDFPGLAAAVGSGDSSSRAAALVAAGRVLPVLDGFDEIELGLHEAAVRQLNSHAQVPLVITSRQEEYAAAVRDADAVTAAAVVVLEELTPQDLAAYLPRTAAGHRTGTWDAVLERMRIQPYAPESARLHRVLTNPLMVFLSRAVYSDVPGHDPAELLDVDRFPTDQVLQEHLVAAFVPAAYRTDLPDASRSAGGRPRRGWNAEQANRYLTYLADHLRRAGTRDLAWWQLRDTIPRPRRTLILAVADALVAMLTLHIIIGSPTGVSGLVTAGLVVTLASCLTVAVTVGLTSAGVRRMPRFLTSKAGIAIGTALITGLFSGVVHGCLDTLANGLVQGAAYGIVGGVAAWVVRLRTTGPQPARTRFQFRGRFRVLAGRFAVGVAVGIAFGFAAGFAYGLAVGALNGFSFGLAFGLVAGGLIGPVFGLVAGLAAILAYGFEASLNVDEVASTAESLSRDRGNSLRKMFSATLLVGCAFGLTIGFDSGLAYGLAAGWLSVRVTSAWFFWTVLVRGWLPLTGALPWRVRAFLADAHQRGVLRQTGSVYQFRHAALQEHLTTEVPSLKP